MFRNMRRNKQQLSESESVKILEQGTNGILSVIGDNGFPYGVPLSYVYQNGKIYFHCAKNGHKLDAIMKNNKVSFTVVGQDKVAARKMTTYYQSVIAFGTARILDDPEEKLSSHLVLSNKYSSQYPDEIEKGIEKYLDQMLMIEIDIMHMTGKECIELVKRKEIKVKVYEGIADDAKKIREKVFVEEQGFVDEFDDTDKSATHIVLYNNEEIPIATCRIFTEINLPKTYILGRLAVIKEYREKKMGTRAVKEAEKCVLEKGGTSISLHAQCRAKEFYNKLGYEEYGEIEDDQGCPHIWMKKDLK